MQLSRPERAGVCQRLCAGCYFALMNIVDRLLILMLVVAAMAAIADPLLL
jgi:hypothetical protein